MSEALPLALAICAFIFSFLAFAAAATAAVIVIAWSKSSHKIVQLPASFNEEQTRYEIDLPPGLINDLPSAPETSSVQTASQYMRKLQSQDDALEAEYEQQDDTW